jgi:tight adherence protein C
VTTLLVVGLLLTGLSVVLALRSVSLARPGRRALDQISSYGFNSPAATAAAESQSLVDVLSRLALQTGERALERSGRLRRRERELRRLLDAAGMYGTTVSALVGYRLLAVAAPLALLALGALRSGGLDTRLLLGSVTLIVMAWYAPYVRLQRRARFRIEQIDREVPELVDLLVTTVEGGVGFAGGLQLASRSIQGPLGQELRLALQQQTLGLTPEETLRNLSDRVDSPAVHAFTQALVQGESLGVSTGSIMRDLAVDMRKRRRQSAEERAQKTPTKILFPLIVLILPAMFIVTLGPVLMRALDFFSG